MGRMKDMFIDMMIGQEDDYSDRLNNWSPPAGAPPKTARPIISEYDAEEMVKAGVLVENADKRPGAPRYVPSWKEAYLA